MNKSMLIGLVLGVALTGFSGIALAQPPEKDETIFTTYYPAFYGVYNEMQASKLSAGDINEDGNIDDKDLLPAGKNLGGIPGGAIVMWAGTIANIPSGWALCDGNNGTPDLRDRFIYGVSAGQNPGVTGGATGGTVNIGEPYAALLQTCLYYETLRKNKKGQSDFFFARI